MATKTKRPRRKRTARAAAPRTDRVDQPLTESPIGDKLTEDVKLAVVQRLAMYDTPSQVVEFVKDEYGIEITRQAAQYYDPTRGQKPPQQWCDIFEATRKDFLDKTAEIPIAQRSFRLRRLQRMAEAAEKRGAWVVAAQLYEQAAKDEGGAFTNKRNVGGVVGHINLEDLTDPQLQHLANGGSVADLPR
jgi:hypothetical protein